jgi:eukaryotic-like serine/threonine-protein kinase
MMLSAGDRLGPYAIETALGAGGMGEVYRARDCKLGRDVAIKILPELFAADSERVARFTRDAKTLASLNHPHICTLHDIGSEGGVDFLVMEYLEGETLATRLAKGPLPLDQVLRPSSDARPWPRQPVSTDMNPGTYDGGPTEERL